MDTYAITVVVDGFDMDSEWQNASLECLPHDAVVSRSAGVTRIDAEVTAPTAREALAQLVSDLRTINVHVVRIDLDLVSIADIAERADVSRETARLWTTGQRRAGFPPPFATVGNTLVWCWSDVASWAVAAQMTLDVTAHPLPLHVIEVLNGALALGRSASEGWIAPRSAPVAHIGQRRVRHAAQDWRPVHSRSA